MIHEVDIKNNYNNINKEDILTFDDGLYSQYKYSYLFNIKNIKYYFISTNIINNTNKFNNNFITASNAHKEYFNNNNLTNYMSIEQIKELSNNPNTFIGGHGHNHLKLYNYNNNLKNKINIIKNDIDNMINIFNNVLNIELKYFCWPYNYEDYFYKIYLKKYNKDIIFFGPERKDIND